MAAGHVGQQKSFHSLFELWNFGDSESAAAAAALDVIMMRPIGPICVRSIVLNPSFRNESRKHLSSRRDPWAIESSVTDYMMMMMSEQSHWAASASLMLTRPETKRRVQKHATPPFLRDENLNREVRRLMSLGWLCHGFLTASIFSASARSCAFHPGTFCPNGEQMITFISCCHWELSKNWCLATPGNDVDVFSWD